MRKDFSFSSSFSPLSLRTGGVVTLFPNFSASQERLARCGVDRPIVSSLPLVPGRILNAKFANVDNT
eukprot:5086870-Pyramimonas_sp.AAC.1